MCGYEAYMVDMRLTSVDLQQENKYANLVLTQELRDR